jgi:hypothetical protein
LEVPVEMMNMDEALDVKPRVTIEGKQLELLKIESATSGQKYQMSCMATISGINQNSNEDGTTHNLITFELSVIEMVPAQKEYNPSDLYQAG